MTQYVEGFREWRRSTGRAWNEDLWPRAFWFDIFLSHRRFDWSRELADTLVGQGVRVYHDNDRSVSDEQVQLELDEALRHSRFVAVCATPNLGESAYCRAEFVPAIQHGAQLDLTRVLVGLVSRLDACEILGLLDPLTEIAWIDRCQAPRLIDALADAIRAAGFVSTATAISEEAAALVGGAELARCRIELVFNDEYLDFKRTQARRQQSEFDERFDSPDH